MAVLDLKNEKEVKRYNDFLKRQGYVSFMQNINWGMVKNNWKEECIYLERDNEIYACMLILIQQVPNTKVTFMYSPRGPVCDIYNIKVLNELMHEARKIAKKYNAYTLTFDPPIKNDESLKKILNKNGFTTQKENCDPKDFINPKFEAKLYLEGKTTEDLKKDFKSKTRYNINLADKHNLKARYSHDEKDLKIFYDIYKTTVIRDKIGARPYDYLKRMLRAFNEEELRIYVIEKDGEPLSSAISICYGNELYYVYGASSNEKRNLMPNYKMQMEMIKWGIERNCKTYNFGGIIHLNKDDGLYRFKTGFTLADGIEDYIGKISVIYKPYDYFKLVTLKKIKSKLFK